MAASGDFRLPRLESPVIGVIGGSGLLKSRSELFYKLTFDEVPTSQGTVLVRHGKLEGGGTLVFVQRHEATPSRKYTQPADINYAAIALALKAVGCSRVIGVCSVGSLRTSIGVGSIVVPDDYYCPYDVRRVYSDYRGHYMPGFDETSRGCIVDALHELRLRPVVRYRTEYKCSNCSLYVSRGAQFRSLLVHPNVVRAQSAGTYVNAKGPRFETKAEIRTFAQSGEILGMTGAHEASCCQETKLQYAMVCLVDNFCHGIGHQLSVEEFHTNQKKNLDTLETMVDGIIRGSAQSARAEAEDPTQAGVPSASSGAGTHAKMKLPAAAMGGKGKEEEEGRSGSSDVVGAGGVVRSGTPQEIAQAKEQAKAATEAAATGAREEVDLVVHAGYVVPIVPRGAVLRNHAVAVRGGRIVAVVPSTEASTRFSAAQVRRLPGHVVMPGLVNCHTHLGMSVMRGLKGDLDLMTWLQTAIWPAEARMMSTPEKAAKYVRAGTRLGVLESIRGGVTCVNDMYFFPEQTAEVIVESGVRGTVGVPVLEFPSTFASGADDYIAKTEAFILKWRDVSNDKHQGRLRFAIAPHAPYTVSDESFKKSHALAVKYGVPMHVHVHETADEVDHSATGKPGPAKHQSQQLLRPLANFKRMGVLDKHLIAVHVANASKDDIRDLQEGGASVVHCPNSNLQLVSGLCPVARMMEAGVNVALGTDSTASNDSLDMFGELKLAAALGKMVRGDSRSLPVAAALEMATINGAKAIGLGDEIGSLEPGKSADFIAVRTDVPEMQPIFSVERQLVYSASRSLVTDSWACGRALLVEGEVQTMDVDSIMADAVDYGVQLAAGMEQDDAKAAASKAMEGEEDEGGPASEEGGPAATSGSGS